MENKYEESSDLTEFFLNLEDAMSVAQEATDSVLTERERSISLFHWMPRSWRTAGKVRGIQAQERYTLSKGRPETSATKNERAFVVPGPPVLRDEDSAGGSVCSNTPQKPLIPRPAEND
ncbi:hypothetical protein PC123_g12630 [Phytophthora cactorum]|nr:hypothetical protein PC123_g12630 [Phytophthora cactorum]